MAWLVLLFCPAAVCPAAAEDQSESDGKVDEGWDVVYMAGQRIGYAHTRTAELTDNDGNTVFATDMFSYMQINRFGGQLVMKSQQHTEEDEAGRMLQFRFNMDNPPFSNMLAVGRLDGDELTVEMTAAGRTTTSTLDAVWEALGPAALDRAMTSGIPDAGESRSWKTFEPSLNRYVTLTVEGHGMVETRLLDGSTIEVRRITQRYDVADLPPTDVYLDGEGNSVKSEMSLIGIQIVTYRVDEETALEEIGNEPVDLAVATLVPVEEIPRAHGSKRIRYRIEVSGGGAADSFATGPTQSIEELGDDAIELTVTTIRPETGDSSSDVPGEYLESTQFLECADPRVIEHADAAAGDATGPAEMALAMERYVHVEMKDKNYSTSLATASEVAREMAGDCTEHAVLLAAMLRAKEIPSRVCVGLVYSPQHSGFAGHMWTEAWLGDVWVPLDATLGQGGIGAAHLKVSDSSLAENAPTPIGAFLPIMHLLGKTRIEVLEVE